MLFYKVNPAYDQAQVTKTVRGRTAITNFLIGNELYTKKELDKLLSGATLRGCGIKRDTVVFAPVNIPKNKTHWFFGARFEDQLN